MGVCVCVGGGGGGGVRGHGTFSPLVLYSSSSLEELTPFSLKD